ncbi:MAG: YicC family protein [Bacteroidetes bacterium]|nr:YicC family protein [Bacteroidota bacterium]
MIKSMTGFGKATCELPDKIVTIEVRSLNSKQTDINTKLHPIFREYEMEIRNLIQQKLIRGKIDVMISYELNENAGATKLNRGVIMDYYNQIDGIQRELQMTPAEGVMQAILRMPDVFANDKNELKKDEWEKLKTYLLNALDELTRFRDQEGKALDTDIREHIKHITDYLSQITPYEQERIESVKQRIESSLQEMEREDIDKSRFEQELIFYLEKLDISEEKVRLNNHCKYFLETLECDDAIGKKLAFIAQEIGREINTIGSKANHAEIQKLVVLMKDELEKIKEQSLNVL